MQFAHLADTHMGYRQYGLVERENDFFKYLNKPLMRLLMKDQILLFTPEIYLNTQDRPPEHY